MRLYPTSRGARDSAFGFALTLVLLLNPVAPWSISKVSAQQNPSAYQTVSSRARPDYDAIGGRVGSFILFPSIDIAEAYDDNIFRVESGEVSDFITSISPEIGLISQWNNHELTIKAGADAQWYAEQNDENTTDYFIRADGRLDVRRSTKLVGSASYQKLHDPRGDPNAPAASEKPVEYKLLRTNLGGGHTFNRLRFAVDGNVAAYRYDNAVNRNTGAIIVENDRDRQEYEVGLRVGYEIQRQFEAFFRGTLNHRQYERLQDGFDRDSKGYEVVAGTALDFGGLLYGDVFVGYISQDYDDPSFATVDGPIIGGSLLWNITELTTVNPFIRRTIEETTIFDSSGILATTAGVNVDHELLRNVLLNGTVSYTNDRFDGSAPGVEERDDHYISFGLGATYLINRYSRASLRYNFDARESNVAGDDYDNNMVTLSVRVQL